MRSKKWREKEFSTETLTQGEVDEILAETEDYAKGNAPVNRNTQFAEGLEDLSELQKSQHNREEMSKTHSYNGFEAARSFDPEIKLYEEEKSDFSQFTLEPITPGDDKYDDIMENYEEVMEKMSSNPTKPKYWFKEQGDHWYCSCGQLNKGPICASCGLERDLLRALFFLHEPGDEPGNYEGMDIHYTDVDMKGAKLSTKVKLIIAIIIIAILLAGTGLFSYFYVIKPSIEKEAAANEKAIAESIEANVPRCVSDADTFVRNSYISAGDTLLKNDKFNSALKLYKLAQSINDNDEIQDKILSVKYKYVCANKDTGGEKFEKYLMELHKIGYSDINSIYDEYFAWHIDIIANTSNKDTTTDISSASRADTVFFHVFASGGAPDEKLDVYYEASWPSGSKQTEMLGTDWVAGSSQTVPFYYPVPILGKEGTLSFKVYNKSTQELLASDSIELEK